MEGNNKDRWLIDDVKAVSQCFAPTTILASNPTLNSIDLDWINTGGAVKWNIEVIPDYAAPTGNGEIYIWTTSFYKKRTFT